MTRRPLDAIFVALVTLLVLFGFVIYLSATLGIIAHQELSLTSVLFNHLFLGLFLGTLALIIISRLRYRTWRKYALTIFAASLLVTLLVFIPKLGFEYAGARRWIHVGSLSFQPSEFLKIGYLVYLAAWLSGVKDKVRTWRFGIMPFLIVNILTGFILLLEPDTDTFAVLFVGGLAMLIVAGARKRDVALIMLAAAVALAVIFAVRPYLKERFLTYLNPSRDPQGSGYQIQQSLISIGSGGWSGRGFGRSVQKFNFLPEPIGDSIFAVAAEEFGFLGASVLILLFALFGLRGLKISSKVPDLFGRLLGVGIAILIVSQSFLNIGAMLGVVPLSGLPLTFVSHGGTAMLFALIEVGMLLSISRMRAV